MDMMFYSNLFWNVGRTISNNSGLQNYALLFLILFIRRAKKKQVSLYY